VNEVYIDISVLGAYYCPEALSGLAEECLQRVAVPVISLLTEVEFFSLVTRKKRVGDFGEAQARNILMEFQSHLESGLYKVLVHSFDDYMRAREMIGSMKSSLRTLDALHLAIAKSEDIPIATADLLLVQAARRLKIKVVSLKAD